MQAAVPWSCVTPECRRKPPTLAVKDVPVSAMEPLLIICITCSRLLVSCEHCHVLLDISKRNSDNGLFCQRCGWITLMDATLRSLLQLTEFNRSMLKHMNAQSFDVLRARQQLAECEAQLQQAKATPPVATVEHGRSKRSQPPEVISSDAERTMPLEGESEGLQVERKRLLSELHHKIRKWDQLVIQLSQSKDGSTQQSFSSTHVNILRILYEGSLPKEHLAELTADVEQFLQHQPTLLQMKFDFIAETRAVEQMQQLNSPVLRQHTTANVTNLLLNYTQARVDHRWLSYQASARQHLPLIAMANKHLLALYKAAQSLTRAARSTTESESKESANEFVPSAPRGCSTSPFQPLKRRRYSGSNSSKRLHMSTSGASTADDEVVRMQQSIDYNNRVTEIVKKVELWRALGWTVASSCVVSMVDIAASEDK